MACTMASAIGAGAVAPACPALSSSIGIPARMHFTIVMQLSSQTSSRDDEAVGIAHERPRAPGLLATRHPVQQVEAALDMRRVTERGADMLRRARKDRHTRWISMSKLSTTSRQNHGPLEEVHIVEVMRDPGRVVQVLRGRVAILQRHRIDDMHRSTAVPKCTLLRSCRSYFGSRACSVMSRAAMASMSSTSALRKADAPVIALHRPRPGSALHPRIRRLAQPDHLHASAPRHGSGHALLGQWLVSARPADPPAPGAGSRPGGAGPLCHPRRPKPPDRRARAGSHTSPTSLHMTRSLPASVPDIPHGGPGA